MNPEDLAPTENDENPQFAAWSNMVDDIEQEDAEPDQLDNETATSEETESSSEYEGKTLREKRLLYYDGKYDPSFDELVQMQDDEGFYESDEYKQYVRNRSEAAAQEYPEAFHSNLSEALRTIEPFMMDLYKRSGKFVGKMEQMRTDFDGGVIGCVKELFKILGFNPGDDFRLKIAPMDPKKPTLYGFFNWGTKETTIYKPEKIVPSQVLNTIAHEIFHVYQDYRMTSKPKSEHSKLYRANRLGYMPSSVDYAAYRSQIVEREAFMFGDQVERICKDAQIVNTRGMLPNLLDKYDKWKAGEYNPDESDDGIDATYLVAAHELEMQRGSRRSSVQFIKNAFKKWRNNHES